MTAARHDQPPQAVPARHRPEDTVALAPYQLSDRALVRRALLEITGAAAPVAIHTSWGTFRQWATLVDVTQREVVFLGPVGTRALVPWSVGDLMTATPNDVKLQFALASPNPVVHDGLPAWSAAIPAWLFRSQRRSAFRAHPLEPTSILLDPNDPQSLWPVIDFTSGGLGLVRGTGGAPERGQVFPGARLFLGGQTRVLCRATVCWGQPASPPHQLARAGVRIELDDPRERRHLDSMVVRAVFGERRR